MGHVDDAFRNEWSTVLAVLVRLFGDFDLAEDAAQDAFAAAAQRWEEEGPPDNPRAWLITTGRRKAIDRIRRTRQVIPVAQPTTLDLPCSSVEATAMTKFRDERLTLVFTCCNPALSRDAQVALTLRAVGGLATRDIAQAFLVSEQTMKRRLSRAKTKIRDAGIALSVPSGSAMINRLYEVLTVISLVYNAGYRGSPDLAADAVYLGRALANLMPDESEVAGLLALMLLQESRRATREADGVLVPLLAQDRARWDWKLVAEAFGLLARHNTRGGPYLTQARIAAAYVYPSICWEHVLELYDELIAVTDTPITRLNRAVVLAEVAGPQSAIHALEETPLPHYPWWHSTLGEMLRRLGRHNEAISAYRAALQLGVLPEPDRTFLLGRIHDLQSLHE